MQRNHPWFKSDIYGSQVVIWEILVIQGGGGIKGIEMARQLATSTISLADVWCLAQGLLEKSRNCFVILVCAESSEGYSGFWN